MIDESSSERRGRPHKRAALVAGSVVLLGAGVVIGLGLRSLGGSHPVAAKSVSPSTRAATAAPLIDMSQATGVACQPPAPPGRGHPDPILSQIFKVRSTDNAAYLLGWQIVPYRGAGTYTFGTAGNLLALQPPVGGHTLGVGTGTVTVTGTSESGSVTAHIKLAAGGTLSVAGDWSCLANA